MTPLVLVLAALAALLPLPPRPSQSSAAPGGGDERAVVERRVVLMGTQAEVTVTAADRAAALAASEAAVEALEGAEARLSTWTEASELARLNRAQVGEPAALSPELAGELAAAADCRRATGGAFDHGLGPLVAAWGLREGGRLPHPAELAAAWAASGGDGLELGPGATATRRRPGLRIEEGGFGKGAALDAALARLAADPAVETARLDLGGQIALLSRAGRAPRETEVAVAHPRERERPVVALSIPSGSVATSGNSERGIVVGGQRRSHILDLRTGSPAPDFGSLTVWVPEPGGALRADCLSTGLYVLGPKGAFAWAAAHPGVEVLVIRPRIGADRGFEALATPGLRGRLRALDPEVVREIRFVSGEMPPAREAGNQKKERGSRGWQTGAATRRSSSSRGHRVGAR